MCGVWTCCATRSRMRRTIMTATTKVPIASLPLPAPKDRLNQNLKPDPAATSVSAFRNEILNNQPSLQRRARIIPSSAQFSYTTPLPIPFPYRIPQPDSPQDRASALQNIETWLKAYEPLTEQPNAEPSGSDQPQVTDLKKFSSDTNEYVQQRHLLALNEECLDDCIPGLDVGDGLKILNPPRPGKDESEHDLSSLQAQAARQELIDVLSGHTTLMSAADALETSAFAPWSLRYCGHQFGVWAGQLGDGRAISICVLNCLKSGSHLDCVLTDNCSGNTSSWNA